MFRTRFTFDRMSVADLMAFWELLNIQVKGANDAYMSEIINLDAREERIRSLVKCRFKLLSEMQRRIELSMEEESEAPDRSTGK